MPEPDLGGVKELADALKSKPAKDSTGADTSSPDGTSTDEGSADLEEHRTAAELDHQYGSVNMNHLNPRIRSMLEQLMALGPYAKYSP